MSQLDPALSARLRQAADEAHGEGLQRAGYHAALDEVSRLLVTEVERIEGVWPGEEGYGRESGLRWALGAIRGMRT